jgi:hypothetical protein
VEAVREAAAWTHRRWRWSGRHRHEPDGGGIGAEKKTSIGGGSGGSFTVHRGNNDDRADGAVPGCVDDVEAVKEVALWTRRWWRRSGRHRRGLSIVKEGVEKFGSLTTSK